MSGAYVRAGANKDDPYAVQSGYLPDPGPQGLPHLPPAGSETADPPSTGADPARGPGVAKYSADSPTVSSVSPSSGAHNGTTAVTITGTKFKANPTVTISGSGVTASSVVRVSATSITANFVITNGAALTARDVTVTNTDGGAGTGSSKFTVS